MFQFDIEWKGHMMIERFRVGVLPRSEAPPDTCDAETAPPAAGGPAIEELDDFAYRVEGH